MFCLEKLAKNKAQIKYDDIDEWFKVRARFLSIYQAPGTELPRSYGAFALKFG